MQILKLAIFAAVGTIAHAYAYHPGLRSPTGLSVKPVQAASNTPSEATLSRRNLFGLVLGSAVLYPNAALASGRATLDNASDRYLPRISAAGSVYKKEMYKAISSGDSGLILTLTQPPRGKTKAGK